MSSEAWRIERLVQIPNLSSGGGSKDEVRNLQTWTDPTGRHNGYAQIDLDILWNIIEMDLSDLIEKPEQELGG